MIVELQPFTFTFRQLHTHGHFFLCHICLLPLFRLIKDSDSFLCLPHSCMGRQDKHALVPGRDCSISCPTVWRSPWLMWLLLLPLLQGKCHICLVFFFGLRVFSFLQLKSSVVLFSFCICSYFISHVH